MSIDIELNSLRTAQAHLAQQTETLAALRSQAEGSRNETRNGSHGTAEQDRTAGMVAEIVRLENEIEQLTPYIEYKRDELARELDYLEFEQREIMRLYYFAGLTWSEVANTMHQAISTCFRHRASAIKKLKKSRG